MKNHKLKVVFFILTFFNYLHINEVFGQNKFIGGVVLGGSLSQLSGDEAYGYHKPGFFAGVKGGYKFNDKLSLEIEFLFNQKGSKVAPRFKNSDTTNNIGNWKIALNYFDVPVLITYKDWLSEKGYYRIHFYGGMSLGYLFKSSITNEKYQFIESSLNKQDFGIVLGLSYMLSKNLGITFRYNRSLNKIWKNPLPTIEYTNSMSGYLFSFGGVVEF